MIKSFRHPGLQSFYETGSKAGIRPDHSSRLRRILGVLESASVIGHVNVPGFKLHPLTGDLAGLWSVTVNGNWRVIFRFEDGDAELVDYCDYH